MCTTMLDFSLIQTPPDHGSTLVIPAPDKIAFAIRDNTQTFFDAQTLIINKPLSHWRSHTKEALCGSSEKPLIVIGHQPGFMHPGVWAKHIVAMRLADAIGGKAINLVVDNDAPRSTTFAIPTVSNNKLSIKQIRFAQIPAGYAYEQIPAMTKAQIDQFARSVQGAMGDRYNDSQMPAYIKGLNRGFNNAGGAVDWVDQAIAARKAVEEKFDIHIDDHRVSQVWTSPLLIDMLIHAERFVDSYNRALKWYRNEYRVRSQNRPIPDLACKDNRCELPLWAYHKQEPRRRCFVEKRNSKLHLFADHEEMGVLPVNGLEAEEYLHLITTQLNGWRIRPRALTLTLWARLLLADLFIHGIGGAKYDRITDRLIEDYYQLQPPHMACVSATLWMDLPTTETTNESITKLRHASRDLKYNPQRHIRQCTELQPLLEQKEELLKLTTQLKKQRPPDRPARRKAFEQIRSLNQAMLDIHPDVTSNLHSAIHRADAEFEQNTIARDRTYFFGLYNKNSLQTLHDALPQRDSFRV